MLDGAIMNIAKTPIAEPKANLGLRHPNSPSMKKENQFDSAKDDQSFQGSLDKKMDQRDRREMKTPQPKQEKSYQASEAERRSRPENREPQEVRESQATRQTSRIPVERVGQKSEKESLMEEGEVIPLELGGAQNALSMWNPTKQGSEPVLEFMDSMESEFGIEPDRLISAFGELSDAQLMQSPEESMDAYLQKLDIPEDQMGEAEDLYQKLLGAMRQQKVEKQDNTKLVPLELKSALGEMKNLDKPIPLKQGGLEALNKKFFDVYPNQFGRQTEQNSMMNGERSASLQAMGFLPKEEGNFVRQEQSIPVDSQAMSTEEALWAQNLQETKNKQDRSMWPVAGMAGAMVGAGADSSADSVETPQWLRKLTIDGEAGTEDLSASKNEYASLAENESFDGSSSENFDGESSTGNMMLGDTNAGSKTEKFAKILAAGGPAAADAKADAGDSQGVESLVKNVQLLHKKGGGEMKVHLNGDGMGDLQLKVAVNEGKVDIQMLTANKETKKILEQDLGALKLELGEKKIDLNEIKVDVAKDMKNQLDQQLADQRREETRQFWQQFKEENDMKKAMSVNMGLSSYQAKDPNRLEDRSGSANNYRSSNLSSRLNVVA